MKIDLTLQISEKELRGLQEAPDHTWKTTAPFCAPTIPWIGSIICTYHTVPNYLFVFALQVP